MVTAQSLESQLAQKVSEIKGIVVGVAPESAARKPAADEWCVNEVLSHLIGEELGEWKARVSRFVDEDTPMIDITPGVSHFEGRSGKPTDELMAEVESAYGEFGSYLAGLSEEQLNRAAHIPLFKETPLGEYPTLSQFVSAMIGYHLNDHVGQLRNLCG